MQPTAKQRQDAADCLEIVTRFYRHLDRGEFDKLDALMARDGLYHRPDGNAYTPGPQLITALSRRSPTARMAHLLANLYTERSSTDAMKVHGYMSVFIQDDGKVHDGPAPMPATPKTIYNLDISLERRGGVWLVTRLQNSRRFAAA